jgi:hypothetical protein
MHAFKTMHVGEIVHYNLEKGDPPGILAAIITKVNDDGSVSLKIFDPGCDFYRYLVVHTWETPGTDGARGKYTYTTSAPPGPYAKSDGGSPHDPSRRQDDGA